MCGITGIYAFNLAGRVHLINLSRATDLLTHRGPDARGVFNREMIGLGHRRLSIIDLSEHGRQPMTDATGRYTIVFNGEIYNFKRIRHELLQKGYQFGSESDTEVLLYAYIDRGPECLEDLQGFFAFAIFDELKNELFLARDRMGIKPLYYYHDEDKFIFASELQSILAFGLDKKIDYTSLYTYLQLNYIPAPDTMVEGLHLLQPGHRLSVCKEKLHIDCYYDIKYDPKQLNPGSLTYEQQQKKLRDLLEDSVKDRLIADVPLGTFLSGGIDSSILSGIAKQFKPDLQTFSIGYRDEPYFDETHYANMVAEKFGTDHTVFSLTNNDLYDHLYKILDQFDQPFADSSAIPVYILCERTAQKITVALSGDGADELFSGYNKHSALLRSMSGGMSNSAISALLPLWNILPKSRNSPFGNKARQLQKYACGLQEALPERYWMWAGLMSDAGAKKLLNANAYNLIDQRRFSLTKLNKLKSFSGAEDFNEVLLSDMHLVLPDDMLKKVDLMSMAHGLEVRVPYLDHRLVDFVFGLPVSSKINKQMRKRILQDAYRDMLPAALYQRRKSGFEVPLLKWFRTSLRSLITDDLLSDRLIEDQQIFDVNGIRKLKKKLFSVNPGDVHAHIWALMVFQWWWKKYFM